MLALMQGSPKHGLGATRLYPACHELLLGHSTCCLYSLRITSQFMHVQALSLVPPQLTMNDFSVHRIIGRGGFGEVYGCRKADTGKMQVPVCVCIGGRGFSASKFNPHPLKQEELHRHATGRPRSRGR